MSYGGPLDGPLSKKEVFWMWVGFVVIAGCLIFLMDSYIQDTYPEKTAVEAEN